MTGGWQSRGSLLSMKPGSHGSSTPMAIRHGSLPLTDTSSKGRGFGFRYSQTPTAGRSSAGEAEKPLLDVILNSIANLQKLERKVMSAMKESRKKLADEDSESSVEKISPPNSLNADSQLDESSDCKKCDLLLLMNSLL